MHALLIIPETLQLASNRVKHISVTAISVTASSVTASTVQETQDTQSCHADLYSPFQSQNDLGNELIVLMRKRKNRTLVAYRLMQQ